jgi:hypothetical protein
MERLLLFMIFLLPFSLDAQNDTIKTKKVPFSEDFRFKDGIYMSIEDVKHNNPIPKERIISNLNENDYSFFENLLEGDYISVLDNMGVKTEIKVKDIWGYSQNGMLCIKWNGQFNRIPVFGSICHFIADKTIVDNRYNPSYYNNYYNNYYNPYYYPNTETVKTELRQYILDMETGQVMDYTTENLEIILARDKTLYEEFVKLSNKKKKQLKFLYLRKFNENNPFYFTIY